MKRISRQALHRRPWTSVRKLIERPLSLLLVIGLGGLLGGQATLARNVDQGTGQHAFLGVRVLKTEDAGSLAWSAMLPAHCRGCRLVLNAYVSGQNPKEIFFHVVVPRSRTKLVPIFLRIDPRAVRAVLVGNTDFDLSKTGFSRPQRRADGMASVHFHRSRDGITFDVPLHPRGTSLPPDDLADVTELYTFIETPGVYIRVAHADLQRRRGAYASGPWPEVEAKAALNLEFATREAVKALQLNSALQKDGVATIMLMNFDTNYPTLGPNEAHDDWPPHWHMHLYWKDAPKVRKVGHFYIAPNGLLIENESSDLTSLKRGDRETRWYARGESDETRTPGGKVLYSQTVTAEGYFKLASSHGECLFTPVAGGLDSGVSLSCGGTHPPLRVRAEDDPAQGTLELFLDDRLVEDYRYDPDTGALLSVTDTPR